MDALKEFFRNTSSLQTAQSPGSASGPATSYAPAEIAMAGQQGTRSDEDE
jgi:hypothetical protein